MADSNSTTSKVIMVTPSDNSVDSRIATGSFTDQEQAKQNNLSTELLADRQKVERQYLNSNLFNRWYYKLKLNNTTNRYKEIFKYRKEA